MVRKLRLVLGGLSFLAAVAVWGYGLTRTLLITAGYEGRDFGAGLLCGIAGVLLLGLGTWLVDPAGFRDALRDR